MQIRILLVLLCVLFMTPNGVYAKAGNGENTPHHAKRIFNPDSRTGRNNHSLLLKTNAAAWGMAIMNAAVEYDISPAVSVLLPFITLLSIILLLPASSALSACSLKCVTGSDKWTDSSPVYMSGWPLITMPLRTIPTAIRTVIRVSRC